MRVLAWLVVLTAMAALYGAIQQVRDNTAEDPFLFLRLFTVAREPLPSFVAFLGFLVKWFFIIVALVASFDVLHLTEVTVFLRTVVLGYLPQVIIAVLILLVAAVLADAIQKVVAGAARSARLRSANLLGTIARWAIWIFAILAALDHLQVANDFIQPLFTGVVVALALAFGLAFGLGGQEAAARAIEKLREEVR